MTGFLLLGVLLSALAIAIVVLPLLRNRSGESAPMTATATAVVLPAAIVLLYALSSNFDWNEPVTVAAAPTAPADREVAPEMVDAIAKLEARLNNEPEDQDGWLLLASAYMQQQRFAVAENAYRSALELGGGNAAKLGVAEASILLDRANMVGPAGSLIEEVLREEPENPKALFYGGLVAGARNDLGELQQRWQRLLALSPPPQIREIIEAELAGLEASGAIQANSEVVVATKDAEESIVKDGIDVSISIAKELRERINPGAMLFLVAREPGRPGPPVAVVRQSAASLPMTVRISDANVMIPGRSIAALDRVHLIARIANGGNPVAQPGDISGERTMDRNEAQKNTVRIEMDQVVQ